MQQLDPHFLFNALSNISSYYHKGEKAHAQNYLAKLSKLIRSSLENSERMTISLKEELAFVEDYLYVEGIRMGDRFDYSIEVDDALTEGVQVPKMLVQNFVENAMKHGVRHLSDRKGRISVFASTENGHIILCIEDNGVGRKKAAEIGSFGTGNGLNMVRKTLRIFEKLEKIRITFEIEDLYDDNNSPLGTRVLLIIPMK
jgi:LytS/YehU family sensor histidine kinase